MGRKQISYPLLDNKLRKAISAEAKTLGVTPREYINLALGVARTIRESFGNGQEKNAHQLLTMIQNPLFVVLLRTVAESFLKKSAPLAENDEPKAQGVAPEPVQTQPTPQQNRVQYEEMWDFW